MKMIYKHNTKLKGDSKTKNIEIVILSHIFWFSMEHFLWGILWAFTNFILPHCNLQLVKVLHKKSCSPFYVCIMGKSLSILYQTMCKKM
jgi:hypothetical protein